MRQKIIIQNLLRSDIQTFSDPYCSSSGREVAGTVTLKQIYEIAKIKKQDSSMKNVPMESLCKIIIGSTRSMGIEVVPGRDTDT